MKIRPSALSVVLSLAMLASVARPADRPPHLLFKASFDRLTAFADYAKGKPESTLKESLELRAKPGVKGHCLLLQEGELCQYDGEGNFHLSAGTVSFWVKPANWTGKDRRYVWFFNYHCRRKGRKTGFNLGIDKDDKVNSVRITVQIGSRRLDPDYKIYLVIGKAEWSPDKWNKIDATWDAKHLAIYVNGQLSNRQDLPNVQFPDPVKPQFELVRLYDKKLSVRSSEDRTFIDEVEVYGTVHSPAHILERYLADRPDERQALAGYAQRLGPEQPFRAEYTPRPRRKVLEAALDLAKLPAEWRKAIGAGRVRLAVSLEGPQGDRAQRAETIDGLSPALALPCQFHTGTYKLRYTLNDGPRQRKMADSLDVPDLSWVGSHVGVTDEVLEPWTPLEYRGDDAVACWGREYAFNGPLPSRVVNRGRDMLREPIRLTLRTMGGKADLVEATRKATRQDPNRAEFAGKAAFGDLPAQVDWTSWTEYDGLTVGAVTITPPASGLPVQSLTLHIPLRPGLKYIRGARKSPNRQDWDGKLWTSAFEPFLWLTDEDVGFLYFCESEANWSYAPGQPVTIVRGGVQAGIELRIISKPVVVKEPIAYRFGFQATPVKPLVPGWREHNFGGGRPVKHQTHQPWMNGYTGYDGLWIADRPKALREFDQDRRRKGVLVFYYATTSCTPNNNPVFKLFRQLWNDPYPAQYGPYENQESRLRLASPVHHLLPVCPGAPTFVEYELWLAKRLAEQTGARGFYTDCDSIWPCENRRHGHGFTDAFGKSGVTWTILSKRAFAKRMATLCRDLGKTGRRGYWMQHSHSKQVPPVHGFADYSWPGEQYTHRLYGNKWFYMDTMDEVDWRAQLNSRPFGVVNIFLPEFRRGTRNPDDDKHPQPTESLLAMCAVNDINTSGSYMHPPSISQWWGLRKRLGLRDAQFIAYWRPNCPVQAKTPRALASVYTWPGRAAVAVANRLPDAADVEIAVDLAALRLAEKPVAARDERTGEALPLRKGRFTARVPGRSYTFVSLAAP